MRKLLAIALLMFFASSALARSEKGHYVVCRLAWLQMTDQQRARVTEIRKKHPHYTEYLTKSKPEGFTTDEWAFMRAGAWAEGVRSGSALRASNWRISAVCPGMGESEDKHQPPPIGECCRAEPLPGQDQERHRRRESGLPDLALPPGRRHPSTIALRGPVLRQVPRRGPWG